MFSWAVRMSTGAAGDLDSQVNITSARTSGL